MSALITSAVVGGFSSSKAASTQASAARDAGELQAQAAREQIASQERMFEREVQLQEPWRQAGINALNQMQGGAAPLPSAFSSGAKLPGFFRPEAQYALPQSFQSTTQFPGAFTGEVNLQADPGYQFRLQEGLKALDRQAAARGGLISGSALKASQRYGQDLASQEYGQAYGRALTEYGTGVEAAQRQYGRELDAYNAAVQRSTAGYGRNLTQYGLEVDRMQNQYARDLDVYNSRLNLSNTAYNRLAGQAGIGQTATNQLAGAAGQTGSNISNIIGQGAAGQAAAIGAAGQARASGYVGAANALIGGASNYANYNLQNQFLSRLFPTGGGMSGQVASGANPLYVNDGMGYSFD